MRDREGALTKIGDSFAVEVVEERLSGVVQAALALLFQKAGVVSGLEFTVTRSRASRVRGCYDLFVEARPAGADPEATRRADFELACVMVQLKPTDYGRLFTSRGHVYRAIGVRKGNIIAERQDTGKLYAFRALFGAFKPSWVDEPQERGR